VTRTASGARRIAAALLAAAAVTGCGTGLDAQTYQERNNAETTGTAVGSLAIRNVGLLPPGDEQYDEGENATVKITVTNASDEPDRLLEVSSSAAEEVAVLAGGRERDLVVPPLGSTGDFVVLELRGLTRPLRSGEYVDLTLRFEKNGTEELLVPVMSDGTADRPIYTGERFEGGEEPALQAPAGGEHGGGDGEGGAPALPQDSEDGQGRGTDEH
jgi:hypothetical protein